MSKRSFVVGKSKEIIAVLLLACGLIEATELLAQETGKDLFQQRCAVCHHIGGGRLVGPDLLGVNERRDEGWLHKFIKSSQALVQSGDPTAKALFDEYKIPMPDQMLSDNQITMILAHVRDAGGSTSVEASKVSSVEEAVQMTPANIALGKDLFQGKIRFSRAGPSCISCHNVETDAIYGGGILAKELTTSYSRVGEAGLRAIVKSPPFPVMNAAFEGKSVTDDEVNALIAFLKHADKENTLHQPREYGWAMFGAGSGGVLFLLGFYSLVGRRRKRHSVNQEIYDRQLKSE